MIDARIPLMAAQGSQVNLVDLYRQQQQMQMQKDQMALQREQMDWQRELQEMRMDAEKAKAAKAGLEDIAGAVRWADTPDKWAQVQQHYGQFDPQLASIPFEQRENALLKLGQMTKYLEDTAPDIRTVEPGGSVVGIAPGGQVTEYVRANPGTAAPYSPVEDDHKTVGGKTYVKRNGQWFEEGAASNGGATF